MAQIKDKVSSFFTWARKGKEPVSVDVARRDDPDAPQSKEVTLQQLKQGYGEVVETMKSVRTHLEQQAERSEQMLEVMRDLPAVLKSIPESTATQTRMLEAIHTNLDRQNETSGHLTTAITSLASAAGQQEKALAEIHTHLAEEHETRGQLNQGVNALNHTLGHVMESNTATRESMGAVVEQNRVNDERMRMMFQRSQKMNTMMVLLCLALALGALALGGYMALLVSKVIQPESQTAANVDDAQAPAASLVAPTAPALAEVTPAAEAPPAPASAEAAPVPEVWADPVVESTTTPEPVAAELAVAEPVVAEVVEPEVAIESESAELLEAVLTNPDVDIVGPPARP